MLKLLGAPGRTTSNKKLWKHGYTGLPDTPDAQSNATDRGNHDECSACPRLGMDVPCLRTRLLLHPNDDELKQLVAKASKA